MFHDEGYVYCCVVYLEVVEVEVVLSHALTVISGQYDHGIIGEPLLG